MSRLRTILLPGLGADRELFTPQQRALGDCLVVVSPQPSSPTDSFTEVAAQVAGKLQSDGLLDEPYVLGGMSFGGSMALEIARRVSRPPERLMLIASNRTSDSIPARFRWARSLGGLAPRSIAPSVLARLARFFAWRDGLDAAGAAWLTEIARRTDVPLLLWGGHAIAGWSFTEADAESLGVPIYQAHGARDWVLPIARRHVSLPLEEGRHLINWTHADLINAWLADPAGVEAERATS